ncbi:MAG: hypothetical protein AB7H43_03055 [Acidimicrobiia bacterium]
MADVLADRDVAGAGTGRDGLAVAGWALLVTAGVVGGGALAARNPQLGTDAAPFHGHWQLLVRAGVVLPVAAAAALVRTGPRLAASMRWKALLLAAPAAAFTWSASLAVTVGGHGFTSPLANRHDYLAGVAAVNEPGAFLRTFTEALPSFPTHVKGHPPGLVLVFWLGDAIGLGAPVFAALLVVGVGASAVAAVLLAVRDVAGEDAARRAAPYLVLAPAAVWMATSGDAFHTGVGAWAVAATVAATSRARLGWAVGAGLAWAVALLSSYGLVLLATVAVAVAARRRRIDVLVVTGASTLLALAAVGIGTGFWWSAGLAATRRAYEAGIAADRPAAVFLWLNLAAVAVALGPAAAPALRRARGPVALVAGAAVAGLVLADLSLLSKGEVERIWLPWVPWVLVATAALPSLGRRRWLAAQATTAVALQLVLRTPW